MKKTLVLFLLNLVLRSCTPAHADLAPIEFKAVLVGRKDLIRNELVKSNNELCKHFIDSISTQNTSLNKSLFIMLDENKELTRQLKECQNKKK